MTDERQLFFKNIFTYFGKPNVLDFEQRQHGQELRIYLAI